MILALEPVPALAPEHLCERRSKDGQFAARGEYVDLLEISVPQPLLGLLDGEKLHIVGSGSMERLSGLSPSELMEKLQLLGLSGRVHLKQIHLIADDTGSGGKASFAGHFAARIARTDLRVDEIKAPVGKIRCAPDGKIWILPPGGEWRPSCAEANYYGGPRVQTKHLRLESNTNA